MKNGLSLIIPAYNEENRIGKTLKEYCAFFDGFNSVDKIEIIVVADGVDRTSQIAKEFSRRYGILKCLEFPRRLGKGGALLKGFLLAKGEIIGFVDADGSIKAKDLIQLIQYVDREELDGVIGSRWVTGAEIVNKNSFSRFFLSRLLNVFVRTLFRLNFRDSQCGVKVFKRKVLETCLPYLEFNGYIFDINLLYLATRKGFRIEEVPVRWENSDGSKVTSLDMLQIFVDLWRLRLKSFGDFYASY